MATSLEGTIEFPGTVTFSGTVYLPSGGVTNANFSPSSANRLDASKAIHRVDLNYSQANGSDVADATVVLRVCKGAGTFKGVTVRPYTAPTGGDKAFTVDVKKASDGGNTFASILSSVVTVNSSSTSGTLQTATLSGTPTTAAGDAIQIVVDATGSTGSQGQGLCVSIYYEESPS